MPNIFDRQTVHLYWFSGSGNTLIATIALAERLRDHGLTVELRAIENRNPREIDVDAVLGILFPTHCFSIPEIVRQFVEQLPQVSRVPAFMLNTVGGTSCGGVRGILKRMLSDKGFLCVGAKELTAPDSFFVFAFGWSMTSCLRRAVRRVRLFADKLVAGQTQWRQIPIFSNLWGTCMKWFYSGMRYASIHFHYPKPVARPKQCMRCGVCAKHCPVGALSMASLEPVNPEWNEKERKNIRRQTRQLASPPESNSLCTVCLRCVAVCPHNAMRFRMAARPPYRPESSKELQQKYNENQ
ncbi:MAG: EFR1 family ferrodoxin [Planctomycetaceae bacterium]|jgi:ferredoxin|nr:EFR1 family ferrodoxin [Planctomycetaceae bacterium]